MKKICYLFPVLLMVSSLLFPANNPATTKENNNPVEIVLVTIIAPGQQASFLMGSTDKELLVQPEMKHTDYFTDDEQPAHKVTLTQPYAMGKYEITNRQFCEVMNWALDKKYVSISNGDLTGNTGEKLLGISHLVEEKHLSVQHGITISKNRLAPANGYHNHPVHAVTWYGAAAFCNFLSEKKNPQPVYNLKSWSWDSTKNGYRLPTEAEWEYAARKDKRYTFAWGNKIDKHCLNYWYSFDRSNSKITVPVGYFDGSVKKGSPTKDNASPFGLYDMTGNVWEWCWDWYGRKYYAESPEKD
ncbi:MAG: formylglycine-generating enzyme family protein, partial [bacterium]|nr:formylglycine-generating enzyme family protein [bacterium]